MENTQPLGGRIALVAGATRGAGRAMAVELGRAGATVYATGRTTRQRVSEVGRTTETIEETAELVCAAAAEAGTPGAGIAVPADHLHPDQVRAVVDRIEHEQGRLDVLVNDLWGGEHLVDFDSKLWEADLDKGLRMLELGVRAHIITSRLALPLLVRRPGGLVVEMTDGTAESNRAYRGTFFYDLAKTAPIRMALALGAELAGVGGTAVSLTPGFLRSEQMLDHFGVTEENWRDAIAEEPHFAISESPVFVARALVALAADPDRGRFNGTSLSSGGLAREYGFTDVDGSRPDAWAYLSQVAAGGAGRPAEEYR
ncbi:short-chain dehydrogenase [Streptomyces sulfonofaciens]|uniref:Short-chain dehydrogenase n=1 Tax=Streptomyces sulfonofaciens TaxID=68272 RepID=A0A919FXW4_9ACTN|nr:SDR family oxidoreductase [Streptomyces sulfonofaciens]GHH74483.1 short-chain dehydrogenase [Streptomyces sulfonofaciens]